MKVVESQAALLSNYEVYQHLSDQRDRYKLQKRRGPPNLATVAAEVLQYLKHSPSPFSQPHTHYTSEAIVRLMSQLQVFKVSKGEILMILNLRPVSVAGLNAVLEDMGDRFTDIEQEDMLAIIAQVLGHPPTPATSRPVANGPVANGSDGDVSMSGTTVI